MKDVLIGLSIILFMIVLLVTILFLDEEKKLEYFRSDDGERVATIIRCGNDPKIANDTAAVYICYGHFDTIPASGYIKLRRENDFGFSMRWERDSLYIINAATWIMEDKRNSKMVYRKGEDSSEYDFKNHKYIKTFKRFGF